MSDVPNPDLTRFLVLSEQWQNSGEACFQWLTEQVRKNKNGEATDAYSMSMAARGLLFAAMREVAGRSDEEAMEAVGGAGHLIADIQTDDDLGEHLVISWEQEGRDVETFVFAIDIDQPEEDDA